MRGTWLATLLILGMPGTATADWLAFDPGSGPALPRVRVRSATATDLVVEADFPGVFTSDLPVEGRAMQRWALPGESTTRSPGHPELPYLARLVATRAGATRVEVLGVEARPTGPVDLAPAPVRPQRCGGGTEIFACDPRAYAAPGPLPESWATLDSRGSLAGQPVARLVLRPVRYDAARRIAWVARRILVRVTFDGAAAQPDRAAAFDRVRQALLLNWPAMAGAAVHAPEKVLVIAHDSLVDALASWVDWKEREGLDTEVVPVSTAGKTAADIKTFLASRYQARIHPTYVILVGDAPQIPYFVGSDGCASDWVYTQLDGDDLYSDVVLSRISADTPARVAVQVSKVLATERQPPAGPDATWLRSATFISSSEGEGASNDDVRCGAMASTFEAAGYAPVDRFFSSQGTALAQGIVDATDAGRGYVCYLGHGSGTDWSSTEPPFDLSFIDALRNPGRHPFVMDVSCLNGQFDKGQSFAEAWMDAGTPEVPYGAVGIFSSSTSTAWDEPAEMAVGVGEAILEKGLARWGDALLYGRTYMLQKMGANEETELVLQQYVQFGDATTAVRTKAPVALAVTHPATLPLGSASFAVQVSGNGLPVAEALVAVRRGAETWAAAYTDAGGSATLAVAAKTPGEVEVTVTARDAVPYLGTALAAVPGCGVLQVSPAVQTCAGTVDVTLWDKDLDADPGQADTVVLSVAPAGTATVATPLTLFETGASTGEFRAQASLAALGATDGATLQVAYADAACEGQPRAVQSPAVADCKGPAILGVTLASVKATTVTLRFQTDENATVRVAWGPPGGPATGSVEGPPGTQHDLSLGKLAPSTTYAFSIHAVDAVGNATERAQAGDQVTTPACTPDCAAKACGADGCGGTCGSCDPDQTCEQGLCKGGKGCTESWSPGAPGAKCEACVCAADSFCCDGQWDDTCVSECVNACGGCGSACQPSCAGKACGPDGCGGLCGTCGTGTVCQAGTCVPGCQPACDGKACGDDGCGGACGSCLDPCTGAPDNGLCLEGACSLPCCPACDGRACGPDGCGGTCGTCQNPCSGQPDPALCAGDGTCAQVCCPACTGRACGPDGCGGTCGTCGDGEECTTDGTCRVPLPEPVPDEGLPDATGGEPGGTELAASEPDGTDAPAGADASGPSPKGSGGGCAAGATGGGPSWAWVLGAVLLALATRRRLET